jgi:hypothetical protein
MAMIAFIKNWMMGVAQFGVLALVGTAAEADLANDRWLEGEYDYPSGLKVRPEKGDAFDALKTEAINGKLKMKFPNLGTSPKAQVTLFASADAPGHWPVRHWVDLPMKLRGKDYSANLLIDAPDVPIVYFVELVVEGRTKISPMRVCHPRKLGIEKPSRAFWPFLDGFETGTQSWRYVSGANSGEPPGTLTEPKTGQRALHLRLPEGKVSVTVGTTALRGWHAHLKRSNGVRFWVRTRGGDGKVRLALMANAFSENQAVSILPQAIGLNGEWKQVNVFFSEFPSLKTDDIDFFSLEFVGLSGTEFLVDDLELLGNWASF